MAQIESNIVDVFVFQRAAGGVRFLLLRRAPQKRLGATWQAVHGKIEAGETATQAALRELREETGLFPLRLWQLESVNTFYIADLDRVLMCPGFAVEVDEGAGVVLSDEHTEYDWLPVGQAVERFMWPGQRRAVREIMEEIIRPGLAEPFLRINLD